MNDAPSWQDDFVEALNSAVDALPDEEDNKGIELIGHAARVIAQVRRLDAHRQTQLQERLIGEFAARRRALRDEDEQQN